LYCPSEPRPNTDYTLDGLPLNRLVASTWYVAVAGLDYTDCVTEVFLGYPPNAKFDQIANPSRSGILTFTLTASFDSSGNFLGTTYHGGRISQVTDGLSNTVMIGERPPSPDFSFGWWSDGTQHARNGTAETTLVFPYTTGKSPDSTGTNTCPLTAYFGPGDNTNYCSTHHFWSWHTGGGNFAFGDGSVRFLPYSANQILLPLSTRAGGEVVDASQY
jgi:prepilin-type processing-associated H-X9-DG protein